MLGLDLTMHLEIYRSKSKVYCSTSERSMRVDLQVDTDILTSYIPRPGDVRGRVPVAARSVLPGPWAFLATVIK